jgi:hypothetical protein
MLQPMAGTVPALPKNGRQTKLLDAEAVWACVLQSERRNERSRPSSQMSAQILNEKEQMSFVDGRLLEIEL